MWVLWLIWWFVSTTTTELHIPFEVSKYGLITGQLFAINAAISFAYGWHILSAYLATVWATTMLHWSKLQKDGFVRNLDITCAVSLVIRIAFYDGMKMVTDSTLRHYWFVYVGCSAAIFVLNELWFQWCDKLTVAVYVNTFVHLLILHVLPNAFWIYFVLQYPH